MKRSTPIALALSAALLVFLAGCSAGNAPLGAPSQPEPPAPIQAPAAPVGQIYLYGEQHGQEAILQRELELWDGHYRTENMRHLFIELPYYTGEFLNLWMQSESDDILDAVYEDWEGTASQVPAVKEFYRQIKLNCPETVFHGTDVGHQYHITGARFLEYLAQNGLEGSQQYTLAQEAMEQGRYYYEHADEIYRENKMAENFIRAFDSLEGQSVMGIYGAAHTGLDQLNFDGSILCMANQLNERYGGMIRSVDLSWMRPDLEPERVDSLEVGGNLYEGSYFGRQDLTGFQDYAYREFWRLENAYDHFKDNPASGDMLPYHNYPMSIEQGQVFVVDYVKTDGSVARMYYRSDGGQWEGSPATEEFTLE